MQWIEKTVAKLKKLCFGGVFLFDSQSNILPKYRTYRSAWSHKKWKKRAAFCQFNRFRSIFYKMLVFCKANVILRSQKKEN